MAAWWPSKTECVLTGRTCSLALRSGGAFREPLHSRRYEDIENWDCNSIQLAAWRCLLQGSSCSPYDRRLRACELLDNADRPQSVWRAYTSPPPARQASGPVNDPLATELSYFRRQNRAAIDRVRHLENAAERGLDAPPVALERGRKGTHHLAHHGAQCRREHRDCKHKDEPNLIRPHAQSKDIEQGSLLDSPPAGCGGWTWAI
jgi:hypothetical protein